MLKQFYVRGGIFTDTGFSTMVPDTEENYGPFLTREEAIETWSGRARARIDTCCHRLTIVADEEGEPAAPADATDFN